MGDLNDLKASRRFESGLWKRMLPYLKPVRGRLIAVIIMMAISAAVDASIPLFSSYAVNNFVVPGTINGLTTFALVYLACIVVQTATTVLYSRQCMIMDMDIGRRMKHDCFVHLQKLSIGFYNTTSVGYILARVMSDTGRISGMVAWGSIQFVWSLFFLIGILIAMFAVNVKMALIVMCIIPFIVIASIYFQPRILKANRDMRRNNSRITSAFNENINGAKTSKTLVIEEKNSAEFRDITSDMRTSSVRASRLNAIYMPIISFCGSVAVAAVLYRSGLLVMKNALDYGVLSAFISYAIAILDPVNNLAGAFSEFLATQVNIERVTTLLDTPCTITDTAEVEKVYGTVFEPKKENWPPVKGNITFDHVWFRYDDAPEDDYVLEDINLEVKAGSTVAIVGETGAGKSTMVNLACRFFEPTRGTIYVDGVDYKERSQLWLHSALGYVQQTPHLFSGTLRENIRYGRLEATDAEVEAAARMVSADKVAAKLENGYDTDVGEGGDRLSTGEKQLVSFARAVIADPPIFVLDEATSSIDTETEALIQNAINRVLKGRTSFIIAHRLSTIRSADVILFVEGHGIVEKGSHDELMARKGKYYALYNAMRIQDQEGFGI